MKIAFVTQDGKEISAHFGRAALYSIYEIGDGEIISSYVIEKHSPHGQDGAGEHGDHQHHHDHESRGTGKHAGEKHQKMFAPIADCQMLIARGMGRGAHRGLKEMGISPILTDIVDIDTAVKAVLEGTLADHPDRVH